MEAALFDDRDSTFLMVGNSGSAGTFMVPPYSIPGTNLLVMKVDMDGNLKWVKVLGDNSNEWHARAGISNFNKGYIIGCETIPNNPIPPYYYGGHNIRTFLIDSSGTLMADGVVGGFAGESSGNVVSNGNQFVCIGSSNSYPFGEGTTTAKHDNIEIFVSYLDYWTAGIPDFSIEDKIKIYPNPAGNEITIELPQQLKSDELVIMNGEGKKIWKKNTQTASTGRLPLM